MPREQKMHRELVAGRDPPDQRLVRCRLHPAVSTLVAAKQDRVQKCEPRGGPAPRPSAASLPDPMKAGHGGPNRDPLDKLAESARHPPTSPWRGEVGECRQTPAG